MKTTDLFDLNRSQSALYRSCLYFGLFLFFFLILGTGCSTLELSQAFEGRFNSEKNNKVISKYCTSCHIHREFDSEQHVPKIRLKYKRRVFRRTAECRTCHYLEKNWSYNHNFRKTRRPREANRGSFIEFEKEYLKHYGKNWKKIIPSLPVFHRLEYSGYDHRLHFCSNG